ncbi:MAG: c-type cytochrome [Aquificaceae bacterium]|nr:c-type cytochrome [Aquificaceae bacterium]
MWKVFLLIGLLLYTSYASEQLARQKGCIACHEVNTKKVGPSYKDIAKKYADRADAVDYLAEKTLKGSMGVWGNVPMPPQKIPEAEAKEIAKWIMSLK